MYHHLQVAMRVLGVREVADITSATIRTAWRNHRRPANAVSSHLAPYDAGAASGSAAGRGGGGGSSSDAGARGVADASPARASASRTHAGRVGSGEAPDDAGAAWDGRAALTCDASGSTARPLPLRPRVPWQPVVSEARALMCVCICLYLYLSVCLSVCLSIYLSIY